MSKFMIKFALILILVTFFAAVNLAFADATTLKTVVTHTASIKSIRQGFVICERYNGTDANQTGTGMPCNVSLQEPYPIANKTVVLAYGGAGYAVTICGAVGITVPLSTPAMIKEIQKSGDNVTGFEIVTHWSGSGIMDNVAYTVIEYE